MTEEQRIKKREYQNDRRDKKIAAKICLDCDKPSVFLGQRCEEHIAKRKAMRNASHAEKLRRRKTLYYPRPLKNFVPRGT